MSSYGRNDFFGESFLLVATNSPDRDLAYTNYAYVNSRTIYSLQAKAGPDSVAPDGSLRCEVKNMVFSLRSDDRIPTGSIGLNRTHRVSARIALNDEVPVNVWIPSTGSAASCAASMMECELGLIVRSQATLVKEEALGECIQTTFDGQVLTVGQTAAVFNPTDSVCLSFSVRQIELLGISGPLRSKATARGTADGIPRGVVTSSTEFSFTVGDGFNISLSSSKTQHRNLFRPDFDFQQLGVGGLDKEFADIFRRAFASRIFPSHIIQELGIQHVRGMLLHGPPGTGKTLIARQIGKALRAREPKIVNGPEILNKFVGQSEENIRALFKDAEEEQKKKGDQSSLHIIIFDEIDAICKQRGSGPSGAGVNDSIVNQLLSKIDGVDSLNNILLIGMTNRLDMIDEALLRPGRLEVHMEIGLPDEAGRVQILKIHSQRMREANRLDADISLEQLATRTKNFSGAEIAGLIRSAASYAFTRKVDVRNLAQPTEVDNIQLTNSDFENALAEIKPAFGVQEDQLEACLVGGIIEFNTDFTKMISTLLTFAQQVRDSPKTPVLSVLLTGKPGSGKTAVAAHIAKLAKFPFTKLISPEDYIGFSEASRVAAIKMIFQDAYKSTLSLVILDCVERLLDYTTFGNRFSNVVLQALLVLVKRAPKREGHRLLILATSSEPTFMEESGLFAAFPVVLKVPLLNATASIRTVLQAASADRGDFPISEIDQVCRQLNHALGIKQLLMVYEMASEAHRHEQYIQSSKFMECLSTCGLQY